MSFGGINGVHFQFECGGKLQHALISIEALQDCFQGVGRAPDSVYKENLGVINAKAREIFMKNEHRSPFLLTSADFKE